MINRITKNSKPLGDLELLEDRIRSHVKAYCNSKRILSGCAVGQAHRGYRNAINSEIKISQKARTCLEAVEKKYQFDSEKVYKLHEYTAHINKLDGKPENYQYNYADIPNQFKEFLILEGKVEDGRPESVKTIAVVKPEVVKKDISKINKVEKQKDFFMFEKYVKEFMDFLPNVYYKHIHWKWDAPERDKKKFWFLEDRLRNLYEKLKRKYGFNPKADKWNRVVKEFKKFLLISGDVSEKELKNAG